MSFFGMAVDSTVYHHSSGEKKVLHYLNAVKAVKDVSQDTERRKNCFKYISINFSTQYQNNVILHHLPVFKKLQQVWNFSQRGYEPFIGWENHNGNQDSRDQKSGK